MWKSSADFSKVGPFYVSVMLFLLRSCHRKWGSYVGVMLWDSSTSVRDKKQRTGKITGFLCEENLGSWRDWENHTHALALPHGYVLPLPRPLAPQGWLLGMQVMVSFLCIAFTSSGSPGGLGWAVFGDNEHICESWVDLPPTFCSL